MEMTSSCENGTLSVTLCGEIDHHETQSAREKLDGLIFLERPKKLVFDFSGVRFMDSSGIGLVMGRYRLLCKVGGKVCVVGASESVRKILRMAGLDKMIEVN